MAPPAQTITVVLDMSKNFDTINIHTLIGTLPQTRIPGTIIPNYIKGRRACTTYRNHTNVHFSRWRPFTNTIQHIHCRYTTTQSTGSGPVLRRWHHDHIYTSAAKKSYNHTYIKFLPGQNKTSHTKSRQLALCSLQTLQNIRAIWILK